MASIAPWRSAGLSITVPGGTYTGFGARGLGLALAATLG